MNGRGLSWLFPFDFGRRATLRRTALHHLQSIANLSSLDIDLALEVRHTNAMRFVLI
jgi:hypothetical protein